MDQPDQGRQVDVDAGRKRRQVVTFVKAGDFVDDLHFREAVRGARADLDEAIVFVFRDIAGSR